jgi:hypothetical protein
MVRTLGPKTKMRGTTSGMSHGYKEERILVGYENVLCCSLSLSLFIPSLTMTDLLVDKQQSSPRKRHKLPYSGGRRPRFLSCFVEPQPLRS